MPPVSNKPKQILFFNIVSLYECYNTNRKKFIMLKNVPIKLAIKEKPPDSNKKSCTPIYKRRRRQQSVISLHLLRNNAMKAYLIREQR